MTVYVDELFLVNLLINYLIFVATARFSGMSRKRWRMLAAAVAGGAYAVFAYFSETLSLMPIKFLSGVVLVWIAFGWVNKQTFIKRTLIFFLIAFVFGGACMTVYIITNGSPVRIQNGIVYTPIKPLPLLLITGAVTLFCNTFFDGAGQAVRGGVSRIRVTAGERSTEFGALRDSGNALRDMLTGAPVIICETAAVQGLLDAATLAELERGDAAGAVERLAVLRPDMRWRLLPYRAVGVDGGLLAVFRPESVAVDGKVAEGALIAISPTSLGGRAGYCALVNI